MIFGLTVLEVILYVLIALALGSSVFFNSRKNYIGSGFLFVVTLGLVGWAFWAPLLTFLETHSIGELILEVVIGYLVMAVITSFISWVLFVWDVKENYERFKANFRPTRSELDACYKLYGEYHQDGSDRDDWARALRFLQKLNEAASVEIFETYNEVRLPEVNFQNTDWTRAGFEAEVRKLLPPTFAVFKGMITASAVVWPATLLTIVFSNIISRVVEKFTGLFRKLYDWASELAFGQFN